MIIRVCFYLVMMGAIIIVALLGKPISEIGVPLLAILLLGGGLILEYIKRTRESYNKFSFIGTGTVVLMLLLGIGLGLFLPTFELSFFPFGIIYCLLIFLVFSLPEILLAQRLPPKYIANYRLNGSFFPFFSLGVVIHLVLRM